MPGAAKRAKGQRPAHRQAHGAAPLTQSQDESKVGVRPLSARQVLHTSRGRQAGERNSFKCWCKPTESGWGGAAGWRGPALACAASHHHRPLCQLSAPGASSPALSPPLQCTHPPPQPPSRAPCSAFINQAPHLHVARGRPVVGHLNLEDEPLVLVVHLRSMGECRGGRKGHGRWCLGTLLQEPHSGTPEERKTVRHRKQGVGGAEQRGGRMCARVAGRRRPRHQQRLHSDAAIIKRWAQRAAWKGGRSSGSTQMGARSHLQRAACLDGAGVAAVAHVALEGL